MTEPRWAAWARSSWRAGIAAGRLATAERKEVLDAPPARGYTKADKQLDIVDRERRPCEPDGGTGRGPQVAGNKHVFLDFDDVLTTFDDF
ncbi:MAG: hypothetical protein ACFCUO_09880, partial [Rhodospirillales bacterium]